MAESARTPPFSSLRNLNRLEQLRQSLVEILDTLNRLQHAVAERTTGLFAHSPWCAPAAVPTLMGL